VGYSWNKLKTYVSAAYTAFGPITNVSTSPTCSDFEVCKQPVKIDGAVLSSRHQTIATHVIETISVELAGYDGTINIAGPFLDYVRDVVCVAAT
jgi:hypothetical protein